jgi:hypothetical protein
MLNFPVNKKVYFESSKICSYKVDIAFFVVIS